MAIRIVSPVDGQIYAERESTSPSQIESVLSQAQEAGSHWKNTTLEERSDICLKAVEAFVSNKSVIAEEITWQMGRPLKYTPSEVVGFEQRARAMIAIAHQKLQDISIASEPDVTRFIHREPLGAVFVITPWNYPYLTAVNSVIPALMAGNTVILKPSAQTLLSAERLAQSFEQAGLPQNVFQTLFADHKTTESIINSGKVQFVMFTGSYNGGAAVEKAAIGQLIGIGLELGGKDPAYVRPDAELPFTVEQLVDGAYFNSGQSCCAVERIYVHKSVYQPFLDEFVAKVSEYKLGNPLEMDTTLGPMVRPAAAVRVKNQIHQALQNGAKSCIDTSNYMPEKPNSPYMAPQVLINVNHGMQVMQEESFGPVVGIMQVESDEHAIELMNDSKYGLTASVWTNDKNTALTIGEKLNTGTFFMNRCDYLDPYLAWTGDKSSGRGCSLSEIGYEQLTRPKSFYLKKITT